MKTSLAYLLLFLTLIACQKKEGLRFEPLKITEKGCADCPGISIAIPKAVENSKTANTVNAALREEIIAQLNFDSASEVSDLDGALLSFKKGYTQLKNRYADETIPWEVKIEGEVVYEDREVLTIHLRSYVFTGGAHGYTAQRFLNFDKKRGVELENWQLFQNRKAFQKFAEAKFREQEAIPKEAPINQTGLMFESDRFYLPENIGFTEEGIQLLYNPYEVASYADGPIVLTLSFEEVRPFLATGRKS
ncbi:MAG TPA: DUF3298 domain-containing protein [Pricia sp.]|nr:DUF3298 domain-containing protein [Pricia sp.]